MRTHPILLSNSLAAGWAPRFSLKPLACLLLLGACTLGTGCVDPATSTPGTRDAGTLDADDDTNPDLASDDDSEPSPTDDGGRGLAEDDDTEDNAGSADDDTEDNAGSADDDTEDNAGSADDDTEDNAGSADDDDSEMLPSSNPDGGMPASTGDEVQDTLSNLNVDTEVTPRLDADGDPLPDDYAPLRPRRTLSEHAELFVAGLELDSEGDDVNLLKFTRTDADGTGAMEKLPEQPLPTAWRESELNAATAGDVDGDGFDELVLFWFDAVEGELHLQIVDDQKAEFAPGEVLNLGQATATAISVTTGDFLGQGVDGIAIAVSDDAAGRAEVTVLGGSVDEGFHSFDGPKHSYAAEASGTLSVVLRAGYLDRDAAEELVVVINETEGGGPNGSPGGGTGRYFVYDDVPSGFEELSSGIITARVDGSSVDSLLSTVALGDVDGDGLDEIVLAGLAGAFSVGCEPVQAVHFVLDDKIAGFEQLGAARSSVSVDAGGRGCAIGDGWTATIWADTLNIDQDEPKEIQINGRVFDDFANAGPWTPKQVHDVAMAIPGTQLFNGAANPLTNPLGMNSRPQIFQSNSSLSVGDVTGDGYDDLIVYTPVRPISNQLFGDPHDLQVWGFNPVTGSFGLKYTQALSGSPQTQSSSFSGGPILLLPLNVDDDSTVLRFTGTHRVIFTEPIVHAALAAPPCWDDGSQVTDECRTSWGQGSVAGADASISHEITAKVHTGFNGQVSIPFVGDVGVEMERTVGVSLGFEASLGYELSRTVTYQTGAMEDTVVATVVPYDQYIYRVLSHSRYPDLVGEEIVVSLPRGPRTMQVERQFFNDSLAGGEGLIDESVFSHEIGDPRSYPSDSEARDKSSLRVGPVEVGASSGNTDVEINESIVAGFTASIAVSYETTVKATAGVAMGGLSVGHETTASLGVTAGSTTTFGGSVGDISPDEFTLDNAYGYGMFVYTTSDDEGRSFEVINYWVE